VAVTAVQGDIREIAIPEGAFDVAVAGATLHHLREDAEWDAVFAKVRRSLRAGGSFWIWDLVAHEHPGVQALMWARYGEYLAALKGPAYRDQVYAYVEAEDTPRPIAWQLDCLRRAGFRSVEVLHKNVCFAAFGAIR
jgi:tRNA (cmo5U34)-methyltransferase